MIAAVSMCKDEADIVEVSVRRMAEQVDVVIVADNGSTDGTRDILNDLADVLVGQVFVRDDPEVGYFQSAKMSALAAEAAEMGATWVVPFDQDEIWYSPFGRIADVLCDLPEAVVAAPIFDHVATAEDPADGDPLERMGWRRREPCPLPKVACRPAIPVTILQGNHDAVYAPRLITEGQLVLRHFPIRSIEQMIRKARNGGAAYAATDLPADVGAHWRQWNNLTDEQLADVFRTYYWSGVPHADESLIFDPVP